MFLKFLKNLIKPIPTNHLKVWPLICGFVMSWKTYWDKKRLRIYMTCSRRWMTGSKYLKQSRNLSLEEDFLNWHFRPEELTPWLNKIQEIEQSPLVLTADQKMARIEDTVAEAIKTLIPPENRRILSRRLLEMAYYLDHTGRPHLARQAQAAGEDLERERSPLERENQFLLGLVMFPLREMYDQEKTLRPRNQTPGRILTDF